MLLISAGAAGLLAVLVIHWFTWNMRLNYLSLTVIAGALGTLGLTGFCLLFLNSDTANMVLIALAILWAVALGLGGL